MIEDMRIQEMLDECIPVIKKLAVGRFAVAVSGSHGKGTADKSSDIDLRLYCDDVLPDSEEKKMIKESFHALTGKWKDIGVEVDGCWVRKIPEVDDKLREWLEGQLKPVDVLWTIWGYHLLPDLYYQQAIEDPFGIIEHWKQQMKEYPGTLKKAVLDKHMAFLRYWRNDYHYINKVKRKDTIFLASLSSKIVHSLVQVLFALNDTYFVGDGSNMNFIRKFQHRPPEWEERIQAALYPTCAEDMYERQRETLVHLINDVEELAEKFYRE